MTEAGACRWLELFAGRPLSDSDREFVRAALSYGDPRRPTITTELAAYALEYMAQEPRGERS